jgi:hypothetical protein
MSAKSKLHPSPKSGVKLRSMPDLGDNDDDGGGPHGDESPPEEEQEEEKEEVDDDDDDDDDGGGPHGDESPPATTTLGESQSSAKSGHLATKVVSSFQLDSTTPGQERSVTALVTGVSSLAADTTAASTSMYTKGSFASSTAPENSHTPQQLKVGGDDERIQRMYPYPLKMTKLSRIPSRMQPPM